jgi:hypothetical protein
MTTDAYDAADAGHGKMVLNITRPHIHPLSKVFASVSEWDPSTRQPFVGDARMTIHNVSAQEGSVLVWLEVEWPSDLNFIINLLVVNL